METGWWIVIVAVVVIVAIFVAVRSLRSQGRDQAQDRRMTELREGGAQSAAEQVSQREDRRLAGMSAEDRAWEQATLQRDRERQERVQTSDKAADR